MPSSRVLRPVIATVITTVIALAPVLLGVAAGACSVFTPNTANANNYAGAALLGGSAVAAAGVNRAVTGNCWSQCLPGTTCNHASGMCEPVECSSTCPADLKCERVGGENVCVQPRSEGPRLGASGASDAGPDASPRGTASDASGPTTVLVTPVTEGSPSASMR